MPYSPSPGQVGLPGPLFGPPSRSQGKERVRRRIPAPPPRTFNTLSTPAQPDRQPFSRIRTHPPAPQITLRGQGSRTLVYSRAGHGKTGVAGDRRSLVVLTSCLPPTDDAGCGGQPGAPDRAEPSCAEPSRVAPGRWALGQGGILFTQSVHPPSQGVRACGETTRCTEPPEVSHQCPNLF